ncbi:Extended Signal Peptide of Type V secretion system [Polaromonas sp. YR568]|uniref:YDG domain-containing protein n=1 Tax=Polaromonas sp. YR568 TaxID=1855301 RepID=UPI0008F3F104|nr:YDG domain-containing protein [Polaromonas sp. YR568]SFU52012.1 Extended Signal Peptide of Type V secretion system [Polaromonas sp. YR568]
MKSHASMNRIYRLVWNAALSLWVAVAENAKGRGKGGSARSSVLFGSAPAGAAEAEGGGGASGFTLNTACRAALVLLASLAVITHQARAADAANASVSAGAGNVSTLGNTTTINQASQRLAIDWTSLSTAAQEALIFNQPNAAAIALNRITGSSPSELLGSLTANGQVFILNPNGVLFGAGSQVNVGGLVASTLSMSNADFMAGRHVFTGSGSSGSVVNKGTLTAADGGYIALLAPEVRNEGVIAARLGVALLAAGNKVTLNIDNGNLLGYSIDQAALNALADNRHLIQADGGQVFLTASATDALLRTVVNNSGIIEAKTLNNQGGVIRLEGGDSGVVHVGGTLDASGKGAGERGGKVQITGDKVGLFDGASVDVSGDAGGGTALIGGDFQGKNAAVKNASATYVSADANVNADAITSGDGGKVIVWSDGTTRYNGSISAKGGTGSGNGGFVEVSGKGLLAFKGEVDTSAANGHKGTLLLDPTNIWIAVDNASADAAAGYAVGDSSADGGAGQPFTASGAVDDSLLTTASLTAALANNDVVITTNNADGGAAGNITVVDAVTYTGSNSSSLTLLATNNININQSISSSNGSLSVNATASSGDISLANGAGISTNGGNVKLTGRDITIGNGSTVTAGYVQLSGGQDIIFNGTGAINASADVYLGGRNIQQGGTGVAVTGNNLVIQSSGYIGNSAAAVAGDDTLNTQVNTLAAVAPGAISVSNTGALTVGTASTHHGLPFPGGGGTVVGVSSTGGAISLATVDSGGATDNLTLNSAVSTTGGSANTITLAADDHYAQNAATVSTVGANVTISAGRTLTASGSGSSAIVTSGAPGGTDTNGSNAGNIQLSTSGANGGSITVTGDLTAQGSNANANSTTGNAANAGGRGGNVTVTTATPGAGIAISGNVLANGGNGSGGGTNFAWMFGTGGNGGNITLRNTGNTGAGAISVGNLAAQGGQAGYVGNGGSGGTVIVTTAGTGAASITTGTIGTWGGRYVANSNPGSNGGNAGNVTLGTVGAGATIQFGNLDAHGGAGSLNRVNTNYGSATITSGTGGTVAITSTGTNADITGSGNVLSFVENAGCSNNALCSIGAAGNITMTASNGSVSLAGNANAKGGNAVGGGALLLNNGGAGGSVTVTAGGTNHNVAIGSIDATGGSALAGGAAGASKAVVVTAADGYVQQVSGGWFNGLTVAVTANRGIGAGTGAGDLSQRLGIIPVTGTARNATGNVATRAGNVRVIYGGGAVSLVGTQVQNLFTTGDLDIATSNGALTVSGLGRNGAGNISLSAGGGNDLTINNLGTLSAINGNIRLEAGRDVIFSGSASAQTTTGDIYVSAGANIQQAATSTALTGNNLAVRAGGYIGDGAGGDNSLNTSVNALSAVAGTNIGISNNKALAIDQVTFAGGTAPGGAINGVSTTGTGNVAVGTTVGALTVTAPVSVADGTLTLSGADGLALNAAVSNATRAVQLAAGSGSISGTGLVTAGALTANAGTGISLNADATSLTATSTSGAINATLANGGSIENVATTGTVDLTATAGNLDVKTVSGSGVTLTAALGAITDANGTDNNITATTLTASSQDGIALGTDVSGLQTLSTTGATGDISISTANAIDTANFSISTDSGSAQNVSLTSSSASGITVGNAFAATNDNINLTATAGDINLNSAIGAAGLALSAQGSILAPAAINVSGVFDLKAGTFSQTGTLPTFSAGDFRITGGTFVRVLGGDGLSTGTAYQIADIYGLQGAGSAGMRDKNFKLANNIDASGTANWNAGEGFTPIGANFSEFSGSLNGQNHTISNLTINRAATDFVGLFGATTAFSAISNLGLVDSSITGHYRVGGLAGQGVGAITNSYVMNTTITGNAVVGGLTGFNGGTITNSYATGGAVSGDTVGGLVGTNFGTVVNSYASTGVSGTTTGGLVGGQDGSVTASFWDMQTSGQSTSSGGAGAVGKNTADMMKAQTFTDAGWNASNVGGDGTTWRIYEGNTGPLLRSFLTGLTLADTSVTYNGGTQAGATTATAGVSGSNVTARNAGSYRTGYYSNQQGYDIIGGGLDIAKADLTLTTSDVVKTYDGTTSAAGTAVATAGTALLGGDTASGGAFAFTNKNVGTGNKTVTAAGVTVNDGNGGNNYNVSYADNTSSTINKANLTVTADAVTKTYDGTTSAAGSGTVGTLAGAGAGEVVNTAATQAFTDKNFGVGNKTVQASGLTIKDSGNVDVTGNYNIAYVDNTTSTINKADLTVTANAVTKTYDGTTAATGTGTVAALAGAAAGEVVDAAGSQAFLDKNFGIANKSVRASGVTIKDSGNVDVTGNYNIAYVDNTASTINKADLTVTANAVTKTYDGTTAATGTGSVAALAGAGAGEVVDAAGSQAFLDKNFGIGNKTVRASGVTIKDSGNADVTGNYNIAYVDNTASTINKANVTLSTSDVTKTYDGTTGAAGTVVVTAGTVFAGDNSTGGTFTFNDKNVGNGNKTVTTAGVTVGDGVNNANYNVSYADNTTSTINQANLVLTTNNVTKTYDGTTSAAGTAAVSSGTVFSGDSLSGGSFAFTDKNFGAGNKTVTAAGVTVNDGNGGNNYNVSYVDNTSSTINKANLTVTATGVTKTYDGTTSATGTGSIGTLAGAGAGEVVDTAATQVFTDKNFGIGNKTVQASGLTIKDSGNVDVTGNYNIAYVDNTTSTINKADLTVTATGVTKTYDGTTTATGTGTVAALAGAGAGEVVDAVGSQAFLDKNFGIGNKSVRASGVTIKDSGNADVTGNYNIAYVDDTTSTINKANVTLSTSDVTKTYDGTTGAAGTVVVTAGTVFAGDTSTGGTFTFTDKNVGTGNKTVTTAGVTVGDGVNNANYNVSYADNTSSTISQANLTVTATGVTKTYDGTTSATGTGSVGTLAGAGAGESVNTAATQVFTDKNFGIGNKTVQASGLTIKDSGNVDVTGNYNITYVDNTTSTINKASLTVTANGVTKTYDGTTSATGTGTVAALAGAGAGEVVDAAGSQAFLDKNFGIGNKSVRASGVTIKDSGNVDVTGNYDIAYVDNTTSTINKASLSLSTSDVTKTYDGGFFATGTVVVTAGTVFAGDSTSGGAFTFIDKNVGAGNKTVLTSGVTVGDGVNNNNYNVSYVSNNTSTINQANLTLTTNNVTKTYDGTTAATGTATVSAGTLFGGDSLTGGSFAFTDKNAGTGSKTVTATGVTVGDGINNGNYNVSYVDNTTSTINRANLTVTADAVTKTYDGTLAAAGSGTVGTLAGAGAGEVVNTAATQVFTDKNFGIGNKTVQASGLTIKDSGNVDVTGNYNISYVDNTASTINKANVTLSTSDVTKTYDGTTGAAGTVVVTAGTVFAGDNTTGGSFAFTNKNAGTGNKTVTTTGVTVGDGVNNANYNVTYADNTTSTINQANLVLTTNNVTKTYDGTTGAAGTAAVSSGTVFTGDSISGGSFAFTDKNVGAGNKTVTTAGVTVTDGNGGNNYNVTYADNTTSTINQANLVLTTNNVTKTYDGTLGAASTAVVSSGTVFGGDSISGGSFAFTDKNAGTGNKTVTTAGVTVGDGVNNGNYNISYVDNTTSTINKANVTLSTSDVTKTYDGTTGATGAVVVTAGTVFAGDNATGGSFAFTDKNAGTGNKTVTTAGVTVGDGVNNANYNVSYVDNTTSTINQASLTVSTSNVTKTYDGNTSAAGSATVTGGTLFSGDSLTGGSFAFTDKNAGNGNKTVQTSGVTVGDGVNNGNYAVTYADNTTSTINPFAVSVSGTRSYDGTADVAAGVLTIGALVGSETLGLAGTATMGDKNVGANKTLTVAGLSLTDGSGLASNYTFTGGTQQASVTQASLTVGTSNVTKTYDSTTSAVGTATVTGGTLFAGDSLTGGSFAFTDKNAGTGNKTVTTSGVTVGDGVNNGNYAVTYSNNTTSTINKADLTVTASGVDKVYDGGTAATVGYGDNRLGSDVLSITGVAAFGDKNAGTGKSVGVNSIALGGTDAGNYNLLNTTTSTTASITPKALTVTANGDTKLYDGSAYSGGNGVSYNGFVAGDSVSDIGGALAYGGSSQGAVAAGNYVISAGGLSSISGNYALAFVNGGLSIVTSNASTAAVGNAGLVSSYDAALQALAGLGGSFGGGGGGFGGSAASDALAAAAAEAGNTDEK